MSYDRSYEVIEIILSTLSLICCFFMMYVYSSTKSLRLFSYTIQCYILLGTTLFTVLDFIYNAYYYSSLIDDVQDAQTFNFQTSMCQITSYISIYGIMNVVSWQTVLIKITKEAILYRKSEQLAVHINLVAFAFFAPIIFTIFPQLSNQPIYGPYDNVCWLQYNYQTSQSSGSASSCTSQENTINTTTVQDDHQKKSHIITLSLLCFFLPVIFQSILQLIDLQAIKRKIETMKLNKEIFKGHDNHIKVINSLIIVPLFFVVTQLVPAILFFLEYFEVFVQQPTFFQVCKAILSGLGIVMLFVFYQNEYLKKLGGQSIKLREKSIYDHQIDIFQGLEEFDIKKNDKQQ